MEPNSLKWVGSSCGLHGPYIFYKAFKCHRNGKPRILSLGDFFFVRCKPEDPICIAELQLLWEERTTKQLLSSSKLYFLPENTPLGRTVKHGEHEVIAVSEKVIVRLEDLVKWTVPDFSGWAHGLQVEALKPAVLWDLGTNGRREALHRYRESTLTSGLNFRDVQRERAQLGQEDDGRKVLVLSYPQYCRYRSVLARLRGQPSALRTDHTVLALGGIASLHGNTHVLYCRDTFEHPTLLLNESVCDQFAPNLKGRPRKKKLSVSQRRDSQGHGQTQGSQGSLAPHDPSSPEKSPTKVKPSNKVSAPGARVTAAKPRSNGLCKKAPAEEKTKERPKEEEKKEEKKKEEESSEESRAEEQAFLVALYEYMKDRDTPIERIPFLGFKQINLWTMFQAAERLGGYELITVRRQWKNVYDELGGNPGSTSAATCTRRHYERLLLPYERHTKGEKDKPLPSAKPKRQDAAGGGPEGAGKPKAAAVKRAKGAAGQRHAVKKERDDDATKSHEETQVCEVKEVKEEAPGATATNQEVPTGEDPEEEEELQLTLKKEETLPEEDRPLPFAPPLPLPPDTNWPSSHTPPPVRDTWGPPRGPAQETDTPCPARQDQGEGPLTRSPPYPPPPPHPHPRDHNQTAGLTSTVPEPARPDAPVARETVETPSHGGRVGKVLPICKPPPQHSETPPDPAAEKPDSLCKRSESGQGQFAAPAYPKVNHGVMSPLAKKKLLSQVCETNPYSFSSLPPPPPPPPLLPPPPPLLNAPPPAAARDVCIGVEEAEPAPIFRPSVIQHAQARHNPQERSPLGDLSEPYTCRASHHHHHHHHHAQARHNPPPPPWHPYLHRPEAAPQDGAENGGGGKATQAGVSPPPAPSYGGVAGGDRYSSPHLHSLYRQTENCLSQERLCAYPGDRDKRGHYIRDCENGEGFRSNGAGADREGGLAQYRAPLYHERTHAERPSDEQQPRDFGGGVSKPAAAHRMSFSSKPPPPPFCGLPYPMMHQGLDSRPPKACRVAPTTAVAAPKHSGPDDPQQPFLGAKPPHPETPPSSRLPCKRGLMGEPADDGGAPERKVRAVTPMHPAAPLRRGDPQGGEELKPAEPAHAVRLNCHVSVDGGTNAYPPLYPGVYPGSLLSARQGDVAMTTPLQYLKSQAAISPLVPPLAFHSMMLQRQLMAPSPHHYYRHHPGGGAALYGDLLHHLYPLSTFTPPPLSSVHPSTRL